MENLHESWLANTVWFEQYPQLAMVTGIAVLVLLAFISNLVLKHLLIRTLVSWLGRFAANKERTDLRLNIIARLANVLPALVISYGVGFVPNMPEVLVAIVQNVTNAFIIVALALAVSGFLTLLNAFYEQRPDANRRPIKGYIQILTIVVYIVATILVIATLIDRSPLILLSGLGAMAAVLMLVFQDTLLSLVASMQISSGDLIRVGDWVEMPDANADGDVIDLALHTVKVQNWDKTITTVPTRRFITTGFKNWRGMQESGGRRMKRSIMLDQQTIGFLDEAALKKLRRFRLLKDYLDEKLSEINNWNKGLAEAAQDAVNTRRVTNIGTFRAYVQRYLQTHPGVHQEMTLLVRQLAPTPDGLPLEIYAFTNTTAWAAYEGIQSDIFDHLLAILPEFGLSVYQHPTGRDIRQLAALAQFKND